MILFRKTRERILKSLRFYEKSKRYVKNNDLKLKMITDKNFKSPFIINYGYEGYRYITAYLDNDDRISDIKDSAHKSKIYLDGLDTDTIGLLNSFLSQLSVAVTYREPYFNHLFKYMTIQINEDLTLDSEHDHIYYDTTIFFNKEVYKKDYFEKLLYFFYKKRMFYYYLDSINESSLVIQYEETRTVKIFYTREAKPKLLRIEMTDKNIPSDVKLLEEYVKNDNPDLKTELLEL